MNGSRLCISLCAIFICLGQIAYPSAGKDGVVSTKLKKQFEEITSRASSGIEFGIWISDLNGQVVFASRKGDLFPAASTIKSAILPELYDRFDSDLHDEPKEFYHLLDEVEHPAWMPFSGSKKKEVLSSLIQFDVLRIGNVMIRGRGVPNHVYNGAANLAIAVLGGPEEITKRIHSRSPDFRGIRVQRYMLQKHTRADENLVSPESLGTLLRRIADGSYPNIDRHLLDYVTLALYLKTSDDGWRHFYKGGSYTANPLVSAKTGWIKKSKSGWVYVIMTTHTGFPTSAQRWLVHAELGAISAELEASFLETLKNGGE